jgi:hypothetical protein
VSARVCGTCHLPWPYAEAYKTCPVCGSSTVYLAGSHPMSAKEVISRQNQLAFDRYYAKHDKARKGLTPEEEGIQDARDYLKELEDLEGKL